MAKEKNVKGFDWMDPFLLDKQLTEEQRMVRDVARKYAQEKLVPRVQNSFRKEETDPFISVSYTHLTLPTNREV